MTATVGPGISLMTEFVGLAYFAEIPVVIIDVQRMGPSTGLPTRTSQGDVLKMHLLGHGDCRHIVLIPGSVEECYSTDVEALDLAQQFQTPVFVATDLDLGMNLWLSEPFELSRRSRSSAARCSTPSRPRAPGRVRPLQGRRRRRRLLPDHPRHRAPPGRLLHPRHRPQREVRLQRTPRGLEEEPRPPGAASSKPPARPCPGPVIEGDPGAQVGLIAYGANARRHGRGPRPAFGARRSEPPTAASGRCRSPTRSPTSSAASPGLRHRAEPRRARSTACCRSTLSGDARRPAGPGHALQRHARSPPRTSSGRSWDWEKHPSGPGWPTGDVERDNPPVPHDRTDLRPSDSGPNLGLGRSLLPEPHTPHSTSRRSTSWLSEATVLV